MSLFFSSLCILVLILYLFFCSIQSVYICICIYIHTCVSFYYILCINTYYNLYIIHTCCILCMFIAWGVCRVCEVCVLYKNILSDYMYCKVNFWGGRSLNVELQSEIKLNGGRKSQTTKHFRMTPLSIPQLFHAY